MSRTAMLVLLLTISSFAAQVSAAPVEQLPDLWNIIPAKDMTIADTANGLEFRYTHNIANAGPGPLEIQPFYNKASGNYQGFQHIYSLDAGEWAITRKVRIAGAFVFHAEHGHFHYPLAVFGLYSVAQDGGIGEPIAISPKIGFCIGNSFIYDKTLPNFGAFLNHGPCTEPTSLRGISVGYVDSYDFLDPGQSIPLPIDPATGKTGLPDGIYWFRAVVDPNDFLVERDESNNITDIQIEIKDNKVVQTSAPVFPDSTPPVITMISPLDGDHLVGTLSLRSDTQTASQAGVQYLLDGMPLGVSTIPPDYPFNWDTKTVTNGSHWLAAQITDEADRTGTSPVVEVQPASQTLPDASPPTIAFTAPEAGLTLSGIVQLAARATDDAGVASVQFFVDGIPLEPALTNPPFMINWDTRTVADGPHELTASATDAAGQTSNTDNDGKPAKLTVTVDNSGPVPNLIGKDVVVSRNGAGAITTPAFSTPTAGDLLIAFVAYDGPDDQAQTATVSGAGLDWQLVKRSNTQTGTSEIWSARATGKLTEVTVTSTPEHAPDSGSLTVVAFTNAAGTGAQGITGADSGAPNIPLPGIAAGNWVWAVGNDGDRAIARKPANGQVIVHQWLDGSAGRTFWVQTTEEPSNALSLVAIHDDEPTTDRWNYAAVEIVATIPEQAGQTPPPSGNGQNSPPPGNGQKPPPSGNGQKPPAGGGQTPPPGSGQTASNSSFDGTTLILPVVDVAGQKFHANLRLIPLDGSPTGYGFRLNHAVPTTAAAQRPATYDTQTRKVFMPAVAMMKNGANIGAMDVQMTFMPGSDPMVFSLDSHLPIPIVASYSLNSNILNLPVVTVGNQKFHTVLKLIDLSGSPTGLGFVLQSAELAAASSDSAATYSRETGQVALPYVELRQDNAVQSVVRADMELVSDSNPLVFRLNSYTPVSPK